jgi:rsbT co-antagonist protein RsbR
MKQVIEAFSARVPDFIVRIAAHIRRAPLLSYAGFDDDRLRQIIADALAAFECDLRDGAPQAFAEYWQGVAQRAAHGANVADLLQAMTFAETELNDAISSAFDADAEARAWWLHRMHQIVYSGLGALLREFVVVREQVIRDQAEQLRELSTPIMPLYRGVLVLPLVGDIDARRATQVIEGLLEGISRQQADVVIVDITGVPLVDTQVANYLLQAARAAQLLGSRVILVGISPDIAQTIVHLGVDLSNIVTRANLQAGVEFAFSLRGLAIRPLERAPSPKPPQKPALSPRREGSKD